MYTICQSWYISGYMLLLNPSFLNTGECWPMEGSQVNLKIQGNPPADNIQTKHMWIILLSMGLLLTGILLRIFHYTCNRSLWVDEAMLARNIIDRSPLELLAPLHYNQAAPVLFLLLVDTVTILLGTGEMALRLVPLTASLVSLVVFCLAARLYLDRRSLPIAVAMIAFSRPLIYYAQELKQYSTDAAVSVTLFYLVLRIMRSGAFRRRDIVTLCFWGVVCMLLSYTSAIVLAAIIVALFIQLFTRRIDIPPAGIVSVAMIWFVFFCFNYAMFLKPVAASEYLAGYWSPLFLPAPVNGQALAEWLMKGVHFWEYLGFRSGWQVGAAVLAAVALAASLTVRCPGSLLIGLVFLFSMVTSGLKLYPFNGRLSLYLSPLVMLLAVKGIEIVARGRPPILFGLSAAALLVPTALSVRPCLVRPIVREETRPLLAYLKEHRESEDLLYVHRGSVHVARYYLRNESWADRYVHFGAIQPAGRVDFSSDIRLLHRYSRVWLLFGYSRKGEDKLILPKIDGECLEMHELHGASLYLYRIHQPGTKTAFEPVPPQKSNFREMVCAM